ncbi:IclR family transcriptional regulator [Desulfovibrio sp. OttesenSCG-928-C06]|nr:IclR family transcriptional regulator [Desulfovibrio sp. OttesenSCG-928-C06]
MSTLFNKAVTILNYLGQAGEPVGVVKLAKDLGMPKSSASRLLSMLAQYDLAVKNRNGQYQTGPGTLLWGSAYSAKNLLLETCRPFLETIAHITDQTVWLLYYGSARKLFLIDGIFTSDSGLATGPRLGQTLPMHSTACGKAVLMQLPPIELEYYFKADRLEFITPNSITKEDPLRNQLKFFRQRGYAEEQSEFLPGVSGIASPILTKNKYPIGSVSIVSSAYQHSHDAWTRVGSVLSETCQKLSLRLQSKGIA